MKKKKRAYVSVYNKERIAEFCQYLVEYGYEIVATEGTCRTLTEAGIPALSAQQLTGYPEPLGKEVRALHPAIYTGIVANQFTSQQQKKLSKDVFPIELVVINLYPFKEDIERGSSFEDAASHIDAGGVALLDAAAKNFQTTVTVCDPADYDRILCDLAAGAIPEDERKYFMYKAFSYTASYNALVAQYLAWQLKIYFPQTLTITYDKSQDMRYGENPHQRAAVYRDPLLKEGSLARAKQLMGAALTYNAIGDANTALELIKEFDCPAVVFCKHCAPAGAGVGESVLEAFENALQARSLRLSGVIVAVNGVVDARVAELIRGKQIEVVLAVGFTPEAMAALRFEEELTLLEIPNIRSRVQFTTVDVQKIYGGLLAQTYDTSMFEKARCVTKRKPTSSEIKAMNLSYKVVKHARSSAIVIGKENYTPGIGTGQTNRMLAIELALKIAKEEAKASVLASDSALSDDGIELIKEAGITAIVQTGSDDEEIIEKCNEYGIAMLYTDARHFKN